MEIETSIKNEQFQIMRIKDTYTVRIDICLLYTSDAADD